jgi:hypothetical protein
LTFDDGGREHQGTTHAKVGENRCDAVSRWPALGRWSSRGITCGAATKGANIGFTSVFVEILAQGSSIYRGFGSMIWCACMTPSQTPLI